MDVNKMLQDLRAERAMIEEAIFSLECLARGEKRRGRPPAWKTAAQGVVPAEASAPNKRGQKRRSKVKGGVFKMPESQAS